MDEVVVVDWVDFVGCEEFGGGDVECVGECFCVVVGVFEYVVFVFVVGEYECFGWLLIF